MIQVYFGLDATGFRSAYKFHRVLGPILMVCTILRTFHLRRLRVTSNSNTGVFRMPRKYSTVDRTGRYPE